MLECPRCLMRHAPGTIACPCGSLLLDPSATFAREEWKVVTLLFADIVGYTKLTEALASDEVKRVLDELFGTARDVIELHRGRVEQIVGDEIVCYFGVPVPNERHAEAGILAAVRIRESLPEIGKELLGPRGLTLRMRFGVATGRVIFGRDVLGGESLTGPTLVLGKRLETAASPGGIVVSKAAMEATRRVFDFEPVEVTAKHGRSYEAFELRGTRPRVSSRRAFRARFNGREQELGRFLAHAEGFLRDRRTRVVAVTGGEGVGRGSLVEAALEGVRGRGFRLLATAAEVPDPPAPSDLLLFSAMATSCREATEFQLLRELVEGFFGPGGAGLERFLGEEAGPARRALDGRAGAPLAEEARLLEREREFGLLEAALAAMIRRHPAVFVVESLEWADEASLRVLAALAAQAPEVPLLLVHVAGDPIEFPRVAELCQAGLAARETFLHLPLSPLSRGAMAEILGTIRGIEANPSAWEEVLAAAAGNPRFLHEILEGLIEEGQIVEDGEGWQVAREIELRVPDSLVTALLARIDRLGEPGKTILQAGAIVGRRFQADELAVVLPESWPDPAGGLARLVEGGLLARDPAGVYAFTSDLLQRVAYQSVIRRRRVECHRALASSYQKRIAAGESDARTLLLLARQLHEGEDWEAAIDTLVRAAASALEAGDGRMAASALIRALGTSRRLGREPADEVPLLELLAEAHLAMGRHADARQDYELLLEEPYASELNERRLYALLGLSRACRRERRLPEALENLERALPLLEAASGATRAKALRELAWLRAATGATTGAREALELARAVPEGERAPLALVEGVVLEAEGRLEEARRAWEDTCSTFRSSGDAYGLATARLLQAEHWQRNGRGDAAIRCREEAEEALRSLGLAAGAPDPERSRRLESLFVDRGRASPEAFARTLTLGGLSMVESAPARHIEGVERERALAMARLALSRGLLGPDQANRCLEKVWESEAGRFVEAVVWLGFLSQEEADELAREAGLDLLRGHEAELPEYRVSRRPGGPPVFERVSGWRIGEYEILDELGRGGMGIVYRARQEGLDRMVALKVLSGQALSEKARARFEAEARAAAKLHHPGIVMIHDVHLEAELCYFSMELVEGRSLDVEIQRRGDPLEPRHAARIVLEVAEAVHYAHLNGIVHRDLKPANILLRPDGRPAIADFGLARDLAGSGLTASGDVLGTPAYMSPEQVQGGEILPTTDVYALGAVLYECLSLRPPFAGSSLAEVLDKVAHQDPVPLKRIHWSLPRDLVTICEKAMAKDRARRYPSALDLADDLRRFLADETIRARRVGFLGRIRLWSRRHRALAGTIAASLAALTGLLVWHFVSLARAEAAREIEFVRGNLDERKRWVEADRIVEAASARIEAALAWRREGRPLVLVDEEPEISRLLDQALAIYPDFPPALVVRARLLAALGDDPAALRCLDRAIELEPDLGIAYYERGLLRAAAFRQLLDRKADEDREQRFLVPAAFTQARTSLRIESWLGVLGQADPEIEAARAAVASDFCLVGSRGLYPAQEVCGLGLERFYRGDLDEAAAALSRALEIDPDIVEAAVGLADVAYYRKRIAGAVEGYRRAARIDAGSWKVRWDLSSVLQDLADEEDSHQRDSSAIYEEAVRESGRALELVRAMPRLEAEHAARAWRTHIGSLYNLSVHRQRCGSGDPATPMNEALAIAESYAQARPGDPGSHLYLGQVLLGIAYVEQLASRRAGPPGRRAIEAFRRAVALDPDRAQFRAALGEALVDLADKAAASGEAVPREALEEALLHLGAAIARFPAETAYRLHRMTALQRLAESDPDPDRLFERAREDVEMARRSEPDDQMPHAYEGILYEDWARSARSRGTGDPAELLRRSLASFDRALERGPEQPLVRQHRARTALGLAELLPVTSEERESLVERAVADAEAAARLQPEHDAARADLAVILYRRSLDQSARGRSPEARQSIERAIEEAGAAIAIRDSDPSRRIRISTLRELARRFRDGADRIPLYEQAIADCSAALERQPPGEAQLEWRVLSGDLHAELGLVSVIAGAKAWPAYERAASDFELAASLSPNDPHPLERLAEVLVQWPWCPEATPEQKLAWGERSVRAIESAIALAGGSLERASIRADALGLAATSAEAVGRADAGLFEKAIAAYGDVLARDDSSRSNRLDRAELAFSYGRLLRSRAEDPRHAFQTACADLDVYLAGGDAPSALRMRAQARADLAFAKSARGEDDLELYAAAERDLRAMAAAYPQDGWLAILLSAVLACREDWPAAAEACRMVAQRAPAVAPLARRWEEDAIARPDVVRAFAGESWARSILDGQRQSAFLRYARARALLAEGLSGFDALPEARRSEILGSPTGSNLLHDACYSLAALLGSASAGDEGTGSRPDSVASADKDRLVEESIRWLRRALEIEPVSREVLEADASFSFQAIAEDPRFKALVEERR